MEYIEGETLERAVTHRDPVGRRVAARPLPLEEAVRHAIRLCRVLEYLAARPAPVIHQDIKPANLIVDRISGEARLVDFGAASRKFANSPMCQFGTEGYAAPEQYQGRSEPRSDVYALAATVYHLLTDDDPGAHPFHFPQIKSLPGLLSDALARALRPEVRRRSTALEFRQALEAWLLPEEGGGAFVFRGGAVAHTTGELAALCEQHWAEARQHLAEGDFDRWFRARNRHDLAAKAQSARLARDADAALEAFLRRLDPRRPPPRLVVRPSALDFGRVVRQGVVPRSLMVRNEGQGYGQATWSASVSWLRFEPAQVGCLAGEAVAVTVSLDAAGLPWRRDYQAVIACTPTRGAHLSIPAFAELNVAGEARRWLSAGLRRTARLVGWGARRGFSLWRRTFGCLVRSRYGLWALLGETMALAGVMGALWRLWRGLSPTLEDLAVAWLGMLPLALLAVCGLSALVFVGGAVAWEVVRGLLSR